VNALTFEERRGLPARNLRILEVMAVGVWYTLDDIAALAGMRYGSSCASRIRDFACSRNLRHWGKKAFFYDRLATSGLLRVFSYKIERNPFFKGTPCPQNGNSLKPVPASSARIPEQLSLTTRGNRPLK